MKKITAEDESELEFCLEELEPQMIWIHDLKSEAIGRSGTGIYAFTKSTPPHSIYIGRSRNIKQRILNQLRRRGNYCSVLIFRLEGFIDFEILKELEVRVLREAWKRWPWAQWDNQKDLRVKGQDRYEATCHSALMALVEEMLTVAEAQIVNRRRFDPTPVQPLTITHRIGSLFDEIFAIGSLSRRGMTVLKGSRLPLSITRVSDLTALDTQIAEIALGYHWQGILDRQQGTLGRNEGIYFTQDTLFRDGAAAASLLSLADRPATDWRAIPRAVRRKNRA